MNSHERAQQLLSARLDGPLSAKEQRELQTHLQGCPGCRHFAEQAEALTLGMRALPYLPASPPVSRKVMEHVAAHPRGSGMGRWFGLAASPGMAVASGLALVAAVTGAVYLATLEDSPGPADRRATISAVALAPDATSTPPPSVTATAPVEIAAATETAVPTSTAEPAPSATSAAYAAAKTATKTPTTAAPTATIRPTSTRKPDLAAAREATSTPIPAISTRPPTSDPTAPAATEAPAVAYVPPAAPPIGTSDSPPAIEAPAGQAPASDQPVTEAPQAAMTLEDPAGGEDAPIRRENARANRGQGNDGVVETAQEVAPVPDDANVAADDAGAGGGAANEPAPEEAAVLAADTAPVSDAEPTAEGTPAPVDAGAAGVDDLSGDTTTETEQGVEPAPTIAPVADQPPPVDQGGLNVGLPNSPDVSLPDVSFQTQPQIVPVEDPGAAASNQQSVIDEAPAPAEDKGRRNRNFDELEQEVGIDNSRESPADGSGREGDGSGQSPEPVAGDATTDEQAPEPFLDPATGGDSATGLAAPANDSVISAPDASGDPTTITSEANPVSDAASEPQGSAHVDVPLGWSGGANVFQRQYADGRLELRQATDGGDGVTLWSGVDGGVFNTGVSGVEFTPGGDRFAFFSGGALYVAPATDPNAASAVPVNAVSGYSWNPAGDMLAVSDGSGILIFGALGEGPLMSAATESNFPIGDITWQADGIAVTRSDTGEIEIVPV